MTNLIIFGVVILILFLSRNFWADIIGNYFRRKREKKKAKTSIEHLENTTALFSPAGTKRTFVIALDIEEVGNGEINISLAKLKRDITKKENEKD